MVSLEFERPSTWSIGKKLGIIAVILLVIGPFLPYYVIESKGEDVDLTKDVSGFDYDRWGLFMLLPILSAFLIIILLYLKSDIHFEHNEKRTKIDHFILMIWGFWFFLTYLAEATRYWESQEAYGYKSSVYPGIGLWMIIAGFFLCAVVGFLEWRYPSMTGPRVMLGKKKKAEAVTEVSAEKAPVTVGTVEPEKAIPEVMVKTEAPKEEPVVEPKPIPVKPSKTKMIKAIAREPTSEEEKTLMRWARHINEEGKTFEQCMKCKNYVFIGAEDIGKTIVFKCPDCGASFTLKK